MFIGVAPSGAAVFVSNLYEGSIGDKEITVNSGFLDKIEKDDLVLADRGFLIEELLREKGAFLNLPPFRKGKAKFSMDDSIKTKVYCIFYRSSRFW